MKKIFLLSILFLYFISATAQIEERQSADWKLIGQLKFGGITKAKLQYINLGTDTTYMLFVKDVREQPEKNYFSITFKNRNETFSKLYSILKSFFLTENKKDKKYSRTFDLGTTGVNVQHKKLIGTHGIMFYTNDGYAYWSEKDVDKLFGKQ